MSSPFSDSGVGPLAGRYTRLLTHNGWTTNILVPAGSRHPEVPANAQCVDSARLVQSLQEEVAKHSRLVILGLPRQQDSAQSSVDVLTQEYRGTILWERPGQTVETVSVGLTGIEKLRHVWTLNSRYVNRLKRLMPKASISTVPLVIPNQFFIYNEKRFAMADKYGILL